MNDLKTQVFEKADLAVQQMNEGSPVPLDFTPQSLTGVEALLAEAASYFEHLEEAQKNAIKELLGSYVLRVGFTQFAGEFQWSEERNQPVLIIGEPDHHIALMAFDKISGRLAGDEGDNIPFFYEGFASRAAEGKPNDRALFV